MLTPRLRRTNIIISAQTLRPGAGSSWSAAVHEQVTYPHLSFPVLWGHVRGCALILSLGVAIPYACLLFLAGAKDPFFGEFIGFAVIATVVATVCGALWGGIVGMCMAIRVYLSGSLPLWVSLSAGLASSVGFMAISYMAGPLFAALFALTWSRYMPWYWLVLTMAAPLWSRWRLRSSGALRA
jgi:hypothetical protein